MNITKPVTYTEIGRRQENEDTSGVFVFSKKNKTGIRAIVAIADGMGGLLKGKSASETAIKSLKIAASEKIDILNTEKFSSEDNFQKIYEAVNKSVVNKSYELVNREGIGTTLVSAFIFLDKIVVANVGDSRAYIVTSDDCFQVTEDHNAIAEYKRKYGENPNKTLPALFNVALTRYLGTEKCPQVDVFNIGIKGDKIVLLCSDGLSKSIDERSIRNVLLSVADIEEGLKKLVQTAYNNGSDDNITAAAFEIGKVKRTANVHSKIMQEKIKASLVAKIKKKMTPFSYLLASITSITIMLLIYLFSGGDANSKLRELLLHVSKSNPDKKVVFIKPPPDTVISKDSEVEVSWDYYGEDENVNFILLLNDAKELRMIENFPLSKGVFKYKFNDTASSVRIKVAEAGINKTWQFYESGVFSVKEVKPAPAKKLITPIQQDKSTPQNYDKVEFPKNLKFTDIALAPGAVYRAADYNSGIIGRIIVDQKVYRIKSTKGWAFIVFKDKATGRSVIGWSRLNIFSPIKQSI